MADIASTRASVRAAFRDHRVDGVPASGENQPDKREIREALAEKMVDLIAEVGASAAAGRRVFATLAQRDAWTDRPVGAQAYVEATKLSYRWSGTAWAVFSDPTVEAALRAEAAADDAQGVRDEIGNLIKPDSGEEAVVSLMDKRGFGYDLVTTKRIGGPVDELWMNDLAIRTIPGALFAVGDGTSFPIFIPEGETLGPTSQIWREIDALKAGGGVSGGGGAAGLTAPKVEVAAHRGLHMGGVAPENSLDAYRLAARAGFDLVETDIQATSDGVLVLMHDSTLNRTCRNAADYTPLSGTVRLDQTSFADLRANYVLAASDPAMRRPVPTLAEFVQECRATGVVPLIEFKGHMPNSRIDQVISETVPVLGWDGVVFIAFVHNQMDYIRTKSQRARIAYVSDTVDSTLIQRCVDNNGILNPAYGALTPALVAEAKTAGVTVACWTVPNAAFADMVALGVDWIATDTVAPTLKDHGARIASIIGGPTWDDFETTGTVVGGEVVLTSGQTLKLRPGRGGAPALGAYYLSVEMTGSATVAAQGLSAAIDRSVVGLSSYQAITLGAGLGLTITASGPARIKSVGLTQQRF